MAATLIEQNHSTLNNVNYAKWIAGIGALGTALQNYPAVVLFVNSLTKNIIPAIQASTAVIHTTALATGGVCSGFVNFWMNIELLNDFSKRLNNKSKKWQWQRLKLSTAEKIQYFGGILVFLVTGILFGLMAFTFALEGPLAILSLAAGIFVAAIMTIQEIETWLQSYDKMEENIKLLKQGIIKLEPPLTNVQKLGNLCGYIITLGNVVALSILFALGLATSLMAIHINVLPALITGFAVAFTFGFFTEYYFYNTYLSEFCRNIKQNYQDMLAIPHAWFGILCVSTNAVVNAALTYAGVEMLTTLLTAASIGLPSTAAMIGLATVCAFFAGAASLIVGAAFWIRQYKPKESVPQIISTNGVSLSHPATIFGNTADKAKLNNKDPSLSANVGVNLTSL